MLGVQPLQHDETLENSDERSRGATVAVVAKEISIMSIMTVTPSPLRSPFRRHGDVLLVPGGHPPSQPPLKDVRPASQRSRMYIRPAAMPRRSPPLILRSRITILSKSLVSVALLQDFKLIRSASSGQIMTNKYGKRRGANSDTAILGHPSRTPMHPCDFHPFPSGKRTRSICQ